MEENKELEELGGQLAEAAIIRQQRFEITERINKRNSLITEKNYQLSENQQKVSSLEAEISDLREANVVDLLLLTHIPEPDTTEVEKKFDAALLRNDNLNKDQAA